MADTFYHNSLCVMADTFYHSSLCVMADTFYHNSLCVMADTFYHNSMGNDRYILPECSMPNGRYILPEFTMRNGRYILPQFSMRNGRYILGCSTGEGKLFITNHCLSTFKAISEISDSKITVKFHHFLFCFSAHLELCSWSAYTVVCCPSSILSPSTGVHR